jgi:heavy metal translocating P-type ATPase
MSRNPVRAFVSRFGIDAVLAVIVIVAIVAGGVLHALGQPAAGDAIWAAGTLLVLVPLTVSVARTLLGGGVGVDAIALLAMAVAVVLGEYLAGAVVGLMLSGGNTLEEYAAGRAKRELRSLLQRAPRSAHRYEDGEIREVDVDQVVPGDRLLVRTGEVIPADGVVRSGSSSVDASAVTGESLPERVEKGSSVRSGTVNVGAPIEVRADRAAADSTYAGIVKLVRAAEAERAPFVRLADRYSAIFLPFTLIVATAAWIAAGDPVRALAVLVVATPCPLILATPIAIISGVSRAAKRGIVVKGGGAIEALGDSRSVLLDKTGTLTAGRPDVSRIETFGDLAGEEALLLAASLDQASAHVLAEALVETARGRGMELDLPTDVEEDPGQGISGRVDHRDVAVGRPGWLERAQAVTVDQEARTALERSTEPGEVRVPVAVDGRLEAVLHLADPLRDDAPEMVTALRETGVESVTLITGDDRDVAAQIAADADIADFEASCTPERKLEIVREHQDADGGAVVMVGDGVNDAPALALADVGVAMGVRGATAASESADAVLTVDRIDRVADSIRIGRRALRIARQGIIAGMGLSAIAMGFAAFGYIAPVAGALLQEVIDVGVILNALRVLRPGPEEREAVESGHRAASPPTARPTASPGR